MSIFRNARKPFAIAILLTLTVCILPASARKIRTKHTLSKRAAVDTSIQNDTDSLLVLTNDSVSFAESILPAIRFYGFDKTAGSIYESFFISNGLDSDIEEVEVDITYKDMKGRQLHRRIVSIDCDIPAHETHRVDIKSWDTQKSFYFHQSAKPRRQATPFDVSISLTSVSLSSSTSPSLSQAPACR